MAGAVGRVSPPGHTRKTWTSLILRPFISGGLAQVALTFRLTFSIHLHKEKKQVRFDVFGFNKQEVGKLANLESFLLGFLDVGQQSSSTF